jgi:hypothetical protein
VDFRHEWIKGLKWQQYKQVGKSQKMSMFSISDQKFKLDAQVHRNVNIMNNWLKG